MIITYDEFCEIFGKHIQSGDEFYLELLEKIIDNPSRYCGIFRLSNTKTKIIQNVTQSNEIKFGLPVEEIVTKYIEKLGYINLNKNIIIDNKEKLNVDQYFKNDNTIYLVEMKIRDDHDSSKKRGQYLNFKKKLDYISNNNKDKHIEAIIWFVDDTLDKNRQYYQEMLDNDKINYPNCTLHLYYGIEFFKNLNDGQKAWNEFILVLEKYKKENTNELINIPDFSTSDEIYKALLSLPDKYFNKLNSSQSEYKALRDELFSNSDNLYKAKNNRINKGE